MTASDAVNGSPSSPATRGHLLEREFGDHQVAAEPRAPADEAGADLCEVGRKVAVGANTAAGSAPGASRKLPAHGHRVFSAR